MRLEAVSDAEEVTKVHDSRYWKGEHWAVYLGPQFSKELEGQQILSVLEHETWRTAYPYFRLNNGTKNIAEMLAMFLMKKMAVIKDEADSRSVIEGLLRGLGNCFGEIQDDYYKNCGDDAQYCQVDAGKVHEALEAQKAEKNGDA